MNYSPLELPALINNSQVCFTFTDRLIIHHHLLTPLIPTTKSKNHYQLFYIFILFTFLYIHFFFFFFKQDDTYGTMSPPWILQSPHPSRIQYIALTSSWSRWYKAMSHSVVNYWFVFNVWDTQVSQIHNQQLLSLSSPPLTTSTINYSYWLLF